MSEARRISGITEVPFGLMISLIVPWFMAKARPSVLTVENRHYTQEEAESEFLAMAVP
jgi:hypothetical protein